VRSTNYVAVVIGALTLAAGVSARAPQGGLATPKQASAAAPAKAGFPRMADGHPDLQGTYDIATLTPLERQAGTPLVLTDEQAARLERQTANRIERAAEPSKGDRSAPPVGGDGSTGAAGNVGGYNNFWIDSGTQFFSIDGQKRTSIIIDPPDGRVPGLTPQARQRAAARFQRPTSDVQENDPGLEGPGAYDDPERRPLGERCILGFGSTSGPPALPVLYNNLHQIVQTPRYVMILNEMNHDARVIRMDAKHAPENIRSWMGDSVGHWEGDTLVVDTTNFSEKTRFRGSSPNLHVVERFSRIDAKTIRYRFTIEDPATWVRPWSGEAAWPATTDSVYEYACHEGNYAMGDILRGARLKEKEAEEAAKKR
jgi:hypothetical protein